MKRSLREIKKDLQSLSLAQLRQVEAWLPQMLREAEDREQPEKSGSSNVVEERQRGDKTYRLEHTRCGKAGCKCVTGNLHGPYWYAYWTEKGKTKSRYIGKELGK